MGLANGIQEITMIDRLYNKIKDWYKKLLVKYFTKDLRVILGAGGVEQEGFFMTDINVLDITNSDDWKKLLRKNSIKYLVAEHVFEHLSLKEVQKALKLCFLYLSPGGQLRIAVPDRNRKDKLYVQEVKPPHDGHKSYFDFKNLGRLLIKAGFQIDFLEYHDAQGKFIHKPWDPSSGLIRRSLPYDRQEPFKVKNHYYTSLIIDGFKPR